MKEHELKTLLQLDFINNRRGLTYFRATELKLPMNEYQSTDLPINKVRVRLDFKVFNKNMNMLLHFTDLDTEKKYKIYAFTEDNITYTDKIKETEFSEYGNNFTEYYFYIGKRKNRKGIDYFELLKATKI